MGSYEKNLFSNKLENYKKWALGISFTDPSAEKS